MNKICLVVTTVNSPNEALLKQASGCMKFGWDFIAIGDAISPSDFYIEGCNFYTLDNQLKLPYLSASLTPQRHYSRKNIGYLIAMESGANVIVETDDDNLPYDTFFNINKASSPKKCIENGDWFNVYLEFSDTKIWPRGYPIELVQNPTSSNISATYKQIHCPIRQGLADDNPDVDAIYRLLFDLPIIFNKDISVAIGSDTWCPFNSQNTIWHVEAFPLLYLPSYCSFRMTDIWRSFIAQRIAYANNWYIEFFSPTVYQDRNAHNLLRDFEQEIPGYLNNKSIVELLRGLKLKGGESNIQNNLKICYSEIINAGWLDSKEMSLLEAWLIDLNG